MTSFTKILECYDCNNDKDLNFSCNMERFTFAMRLRLRCICTLLQPHLQNSYKHLLIPLGAVNQFSLLRIKCMISLYPLSYACNANIFIICLMNYALHLEKSIMSNKNKTNKLPHYVHR